jgi:hypothetical protein
MRRYSFEIHEAAQIAGKLLTYKAVTVVAVETPNML